MRLAWPTLTMQEAHLHLEEVHPHFLFAVALVICLLLMSTAGQHLANIKRGLRNLSLTHVYSLQYSMYQHVARVDICMYFSL